LEKCQLELLQIARIGDNQHDRQSRITLPPQKPPPPSEAVTIQAMRKSDFVVALAHASEAD
jgi:hypothetical protein